jgi:NDP-sugar pyrophosphorylase family protein
MLNILIPMSGKNTFDGSEYQYPKPLIEINGKPLIELVIECLEQIKEEKRFIFIVNAEDCQRYNLDSVLQLITNQKAIIIQLEKETKGAVCSALMAIDYIKNNDPLLISNSDHIFEYDLNRVITEFNKKDVDVGTACFDSVHPKWSFVRLDNKNKIVETAEKRPLSRNAIAGLYFFRNGVDFISAAMTAIEKDAHVNDQFYISSTLNELVLAGKNMEAYIIPNSTYHNFYSPHKIKEYEERQINLSARASDKNDI